MYVWSRVLPWGGNGVYVDCGLSHWCPWSCFGLPETSLGILPGAGGTTELCAQVGIAHALRLGITGERIQLDEACRIGLIQEVASDLEGGLERARALAIMASKNSPTAIAAFKRGMLSSIGVQEEVRRENEAKAYELCADSGQAAIGRENSISFAEGKLQIGVPEKAGMVKIHRRRWYADSTGNVGTLRRTG